MGIHLRLDVFTWRNSTFMMLESALKYRRAFFSLALSDRNYKFCPPPEDWARAQKVGEFLRPFYEITNSISSSSYRTSNLEFEQVFKIDTMLVKYMNSADGMIKDMVIRMKSKLDKY
ncbi:hypothetical protein M9H77_29684 [Catharanthus roseus]|uniref:Uncharacterized protein n=1 Tax=Catharanthus roseus TaxID=4058 RepID=A0ACB9ZV41_CATRO|nr:hypothetical protein M9H77_29684 [Catharanthus roseus]